MPVLVFKAINMMDVQTFLSQKFEPHGGARGKSGDHTATHTASKAKNNILVNW